MTTKKVVRDLDPTKIAFRRWEEWASRRPSVLRANTEQLVIAEAFMAGWGWAAEYFGAPSIDAGHIDHQRDWSLRTFGPAPRAKAIVEHIRKELDEVEADPTDVYEWADIIILAIDGAWRAGHDPLDIITAIKAKQLVNESRTWPDWRTAPADQPIEHVREASA